LERILPRPEERIESLLKGRTLKGLKIPKEIPESREGKRKVKPKPNLTQAFA